MSLINNSTLLCTVSTFMVNLWNSPILVKQSSSGISWGDKEMTWCDGDFVLDLTEVVTKRWVGKELCEGYDSDLWMKITNKKRILFPHFGPWFCIMKMTLNIVRFTKNFSHVLLGDIQQFVPDMIWKVERFLFFSPPTPLLLN